MKELLNPAFGAAFSSAIRAAAGRSYRAGSAPGVTPRPLIYRSLAITALVLRYGGTAAQAEAALSLEAELEAEGEPSWEAARKEQLAEWAQPERVSDDDLLVLGCAVFHELSELLLDLRTDSVAAWKGWPTLSMNVFWFFREVLGVLHRRLSRSPNPGARALVTHFSAKLAELKPQVFP